jgi:hypothetical protein
VAAQWTAHADDSTTPARSSPRGTRESSMDIRNAPRRPNAAACHPRPKKKPPWVLSRAADGTRVTVRRLSALTRRAAPHFLNERRAARDEWWSDPCRRRRPLIGENRPSVGKRERRRAALASVAPCSKRCP